MCNDRLAPAAMSPSVQSSTWLPAAPLIEQLPCAGRVSTDQPTPEPPGSGSCRVTDLAMPVPSTLLLCTVMVKPIWLPTVTGDASGVLVTESIGASTTMVALLITGGELLATAVAVLGRSNGYVACASKLVP